jgi:hypothetical protein
VKTEKIKKDLRSNHLHLGPLGLLEVKSNRIQENYFRWKRETGSWDGDDDDDYVDFKSSYRGNFIGHSKAGSSMGRAEMKEMEVKDIVEEVEEEVVEEDGDRFDDEADDDEEGFGYEVMPDKMTNQ